jgi:hypothetical protein
MEREEVRAIVRELLKARHTKAAHHLMRKHCIGDETFVDEVIQGYLARANEWLSEWDMVGTASSLVPLGASMAVRERVLAELIRIGFYRQAQDMAAEHLHRKLTVDEVRSLVVAYVTGAATSRAEEEDLLALAHATGGEKLRDWTQMEIARYHERGQFD